ncbi:hypothetical protein NGUA15_00964 [Salmonella enterica]|nr:hypothetical protein NGUA15_00964 [Salmonella enterica]
MGVFAQIATPLPRAGDALEQPQHMASDMPQIRSLAQFTLNIGIHRTNHRNRVGIGGIGAKDLPIHRGQYTRILISFAANHDAIHMAQMLLRLFQRFDAAVNGDGQVRKIPL